MIPIGSLSCRSGSGSAAAAPQPSDLFWFTHGGVFKVVETAVRQNEPPPLPGFNSTSFNGTTTFNRSDLHTTSSIDPEWTLTHFQEPSFPVGVEERQCEIVPVVLWEL